MSDYYENVKNRAYYKSLNNPYSNSFDNWLEAELDEQIELKIQEEAYMQSLSHHHDQIGDYFAARHDVEERLRLIAYYMHDRNYNKPAKDVWKDAERMYVQNF